MSKRNGRTPEPRIVGMIGDCNPFAYGGGVVLDHGDGHPTYLGEFGAWDDLESAEIDTLANRVLWTACCDIAEQGEWGGLCH